MFTYLYQVKVDFDHLDEHESRRLADKVWSEVVCSEVKRLLFVVYTTEQQQALQAWSLEKERVQDVMEWMVV